MSQTTLTTHETAPDPIALVERIASKNPTDQLQATRAIESGDPVYFEALLRILERENRKKARRFGVAIGLMVACTAVAQIMLYVLLHATVAGFFGGSWLVWLAVATLVAPTALQKAAARRVAESDDIRAVGPLAEALDKQDKATKKAAATALTRLLPRLKYTDTDLLNDRQRDYLLQGFRKGDRTFQLAVLKSLPQIGDARFLKHVQALADGQGTARTDVEIRKRAAACLDVLKTRIEEDETRLSLLHPIDAPNPGMESLLRPAAFSESDSAELLRAAQTPN